MRSLFFSLIVLTLISCEKEIILDLKEPGDLLCLNCILEAENDSIVFFLTKVKSVNESDNFDTVEYAKIELYENARLLNGIESIGKGKYILHHKPKEGNTYQIKVRVEGYKTLSAETIIPQKPIAKMEFKRDTIYDDSWVKGYSTEARLFTQLTDPPTKDYYWFIRAFMRNIGGVPYGSYALAYQTDNLLFDAFNRYYYQDYNYPFTNYDYIGALRLDDSVIENGEISFSMSTWKQPTVFIINADENFDKYYKSSIKQFLTYEYDQLPIFEPVQIYSNIKNGFGIFGSIAVTKFHFDEEL